MAVGLPARAAPSGEAMKAGSAQVVAAFLWLARGRADRLRQRRAELQALQQHLQRRRDDVDPPGRAEARNGLPPSSTIVGAIQLRGRLPPSALIRVRDRVVVEVGELVVEQEAAAGTTMPLPPVDSIVNVYETTVPLRSETTRWVVSRDGSPASTGLMARVPIDPRTALGRELLREELLQRDFVEVRVGQIRVAVRERERDASR